MSELLPKDNEEYGTVQYWNERYSKEKIEPSFDWFKSYADISHIIEDVIPDKSVKILMLGCGNSKLSEEMYDDGYQNIVNVDYSAVVVEQMRKRHENSRADMQWHEMDVRHLSFPDDAFDVAIDKGTMDAMMTSKGDVWDPPEQVISDCTREVDEALRVLKKGTGVFLYITFGQPHFRKRYLSREDTTLEVRVLGEMFHYYVYVLRSIGAASG